MSFNKISKTKSLPDTQTFGIGARIISKNGWNPIPIALYSKGCFVKGWQTYEYHKRDAKKYANFGIGIRTDDTPAVDIDVRNALLVKKLSRVLNKTLGHAPERIGMPPKTLWVYRRVGKPFSKKVTRGYKLPGDKPEDKAHRVEILATGQQFVAYNIHKDTRKPYEWNGAGEPLSTTTDALATISEAQADALIKKFDRILAKHGKPVGVLKQIETDRPRRLNEDHRAKDPELLRKALAHIKNDDIEWDDWILVGLAIKGALGDGGYKDFIEFSEKSKKFDIQQTEKTWKSLKPTSIGAGSIFHWAREAGWKWSAVDELNERLAFLMNDGRAVILSSRTDPNHPSTKSITLSRPQDVRLEYANQFYTVMDGDKEKKINKFDTWLASPFRRDITSLTLIPNSEPGYNPETKIWNLWQGWGVTPCKPDSTHSWKRLRVHIKTYVAKGNRLHYEYILNWLAYCIQKPDKRPEVSLVLQGGEGAGKGVVFKAMLKLYGRHGLHLTSQRHLLGNFNEHLKDVVFIFADEAFFAGDKSAVGTLKGIITEPTRLIEPKGHNIIRLPNYNKIGMASNEDWTVPAGIDSRRFAIFKVSDEKQNDTAYFNAIWNELENGGYSAMLYSLQNRNIEKFDPRNFPQTEALLNQKKLTWDEITSWWFERLCIGRIHEFDSEWLRLVPREMLCGIISERTSVNYERRALSTKIGMVLKRLCPEIRGERRRLEGNKRHYVYLIPSLETCRELFAKSHKISVEKIDWKAGEIL